MKKKILSTLITLLSILLTGILAQAGTVRFPVTVKWDASGQGQVYTDIYIVNLNNSPANVNLDLYNDDGTKMGCDVMPTITIPANGTQHIGPSGCFAITRGTPLDFDGAGQIWSSSNQISIYWRIYDETVFPHELIDHGKETPIAAIFRVLP
jgi:hypothetical protein